jgi:hypothetical protein
MKADGPCTAGRNATFDVVKGLLRCRSIAAWRDCKVGIVGDTGLVRLGNAESRTVCELTNGSAASDGEDNMVPGHVVKRCPVSTQVFVEARGIGSPDEREDEKLKSTPPSSRWNLQKSTKETLLTSHMIAPDGDCKCRPTRPTLKLLIAAGSPETAFRVAYHTLPSQRRRGGFKATLNKILVLCL